MKCWFKQYIMSAARKLMDITEVQRLPADECIVTVKGLPPFRSKKYDTSSHPNYKLLASGSNSAGYIYRRAPSGQAVTLQTKYITELKLEDY